MDQAQSSPEAQVPTDRSELDKIVDRMQEKARDALDGVPISACRRLVDVIEMSQLDLAMGSIRADWDPQQRLIDQGKFEAFENLNMILRQSIADKRRENREEQ